MIELTEEQRQALANGQPICIRENGQEYVLVRPDIYEQLADEEYDDSPWTDEEMELLAWEAGKLAGWDEMEEYDRQE